MSDNLHLSNDLGLPLEDLIGRCIAILGIRGSGKTNTAGVILEELLANQFPLTVIDIDGEYWGLKEQYEILVVGKSENVDVELDSHHGAYMARFSIEKKIPVVLDLSGYLVSEVHQLLGDYLTTLWNLAGKERIPYEIVVEEAHEFIPQNFYQRTAVRELLIKIALRGRKRGLGAIVISQRSAKVDKDVLTQAEMLFLHKVIHPIDLKVYKEIVPLSSAKVEESIHSLNTGDAIFLYRDQIVNIKIRKRNTFHAGFTPTFKRGRRPKLKKVSQEIVGALKQMTATPVRPDETEQLYNKMKQMERKLQEKEEEITALERELSLLSKLKIELDQPQWPSIAQVSQAVIHELSTTAHPSVSSTSGGKRNGPVSEGLADHEYPALNQADHLLPADVLLHVERIKQMIKKEGKLQKVLLSLLVSRFPEKYSYEQLETWTAYKARTFMNNPPERFLKMGLIQKDRIGRKLYFYADLQTFVSEEFTTLAEAKSEGLAPWEYVYQMLYDYICHTDEYLQREE